MKTEEDEAFDDLARKQGDWGGGFKAKRAMAADKDALFEKFELAQPAQEPPSEWAGIKAILDEYGLQAIDFVADFKAALAQPAQEPVAWVKLDDWDSGNGFPEDCFNWFPSDGLTPLYTAPPKRPWVGLTDGEVTEGLCRTRYALQTAVAWVDGVEWATKQLKEKNSE
jgi:hypothetical protein